MKFKSLSIATATAVLLFSGASQAQLVNGFANGGFETGPSSTAPPPGGSGFFAEGWLFAPTGNPVQLNTNPANSFSGNNSANLTVPTGFGGSTLFQNSIDHGGLAPLTSLNVGETPMLSFWAKGDASTTGNALFSLRYLDGIGNILGNSGNIFFHTQINPTTFTQIMFQGAAIPAGTLALFLEMNTAVGPLLDNRPNSIFVDDISFQITPIPEPGTYALLLAGLGIVGATAARRRRTV